MSGTDKRQSLCIDAVNGPSIVIGSTWVGWVFAPIVAYLAWKIFGSADVMRGAEAAIFAFIVLWLVPPIIAKAEPYIVTAILRNMLFEVHSAGDLLEFLRNCLRIRFVTKFYDAA